MGVYERFCQSCGMPMNKDPRMGGTERDGSRTHKYCSFCYDEGAFRDGFTVAEEMVDFVRGKLKNMGYGPLKCWFYTSHISQLDRWNT